MHWRSWPRSFYLLLVALHVFLLWYLSSKPPEAISGLAPGPTGNLMHFFMHGFLALLLLRSFTAPADPLNAVSWPGLFCRRGLSVEVLVMLHGLVDEIHQFYSGRTCSVLDVCVDALGGAAVLLFPLWLAPGRPRRWLPFAGIAVVAGVLAVLGWLARPWPDQLLEELLKSWT